jgi:SAM-dependent methyltransferase
VVPALSPRLAAVVRALPLTPSSRVLEIGCGPGAAARAVAALVPHGSVLAIDRSATAIAQATAVAGASGLPLEFRRAAVEDLVLADGEARFDLAFAIRVGALDGRHPDAGRRAVARLREVLVPGGPVFVDGGDPLRRLDVWG